MPCYVVKSRVAATNRPAQTLTCRHRFRHFCLGRGPGLCAHLRADLGADASSALALVPLQPRLRLALGPVGVSTPGVVAGRLQPLKRGRDEEVERRASRADAH